MMDVNFQAPAHALTPSVAYASIPPHVAHVSIGPTADNFQMILIRRLHIPLPCPRGGVRRQRDWENVYKCVHLYLHIKEKCIPNTF